MPFPRAAGILLHPTSLPSRGGVGDFGPAAYQFVDFLASARQGLWQVLPLGPLGYGNSPYSSTSAFAGNPLLSVWNASLSVAGSTWGSSIRRNSRALPPVPAPSNTSRCSPGRCRCCLRRREILDR